MVYLFSAGLYGVSFVILLKQFGWLAAAAWLLVLLVVVLDLVRFTGAVRSSINDSKH